MKITSRFLSIAITALPIAIAALFLVIVPNISVHCAPKGLRSTTRMLATTFGDISMPVNNYTMDNGVYEVWYEFVALSNSSNATNGTNSTSNSTTNTTTNGTEGTNSTGASNSTTSVTVVDNSTNSTVAVNSTTNGTDIGSANSTNGTNGTNLTMNGTNTTNTTSGPPTHVVFVIKFNNPGIYFGVGFGATQMVGADVWAFEFQDANTITVTDRKAMGFFEPPIDASQDVELLGYEITDTYTLVKVRRAMDTGDTNDAVIEPGSNNLLFAFAPGSQTIAFHGPNCGTLSMDLASS